jgi:hypothetical protein
MHMPYENVRTAYREIPVRIVELELPVCVLGHLVFESAMHYHIVNFVQILGGLGWIRDSVKDGEIGQPGRR